MSIVPVHCDEVLSLLEIARLAVQSSVPVNDSLKTEIISTVQYNIKTWCNNKHCVFVKYLHNNINIGFILIKEYWNLSDLFILPQHQRRGIGTLLTQYAIASCQLKSKHTSIRVNSSLNAVNFYQGLGFDAVTIKNTFPNYVLPLEYHFEH